MMDVPVYQDQEFYAAIGWLTVTWAFVDNGLEFLTVAIHQSGGHQIEAEAPWSLERKIKYLRRCFKRLAPLVHYKQRALNLLERIKTASEIRHDIIHGTPTESISPNEAKMARVLRSKTDRTIKPFTLTTKGIYAQASEAQAVGNELLTFANEIWDILVGT